MPNGKGRQALVTPRRGKRPYKIKVRPFRVRHGKRVTIVTMLRREKPIRDVRGRAFNPKNLASFATRLRKEMPKLRSAYTRALKKDPKLSGTIEVGLRINKGGRVTHLSFSPRIKDDYVLTSYSKFFGNLQFVRGKAFEIKLPLILKI